MVFGYSNSDLRKWVEEKTKGRIKAESCLSVATETLRCGVEAVCRVLRQARGFAPVIANTMSYRDMDVLSLALWTVECEGMRFLYRTSASFVKSFAGIPDQEPLPPERMIARGAGTAGGLVVVGSYVRKSSEQLQQLREHFDVQAVKLDVEQILAEAETPASIISQHAETISRWLAAGRHVVLFTSRKLALAGNRDEQLLAGRKVSAALSGIVSRLETAPRFLIAKGGITSSDVATLGLGIRRARVLGQAYPGVPVWRTGGESRFPDMPYIVFPGNVGEPSTLLELVRSLTEMPA